MSSRSGREARRAIGPVRRAQPVGLRARLAGDQLVDQLEEGLDAAGAADRHPPLAVHDEARGAIDPVAHGHLARAPELGLHREGAGGVEELLLAHAELGVEGGELLQAAELAPVAMDRVEQRLVRGLEDAERLGGIEGTPVHRELIVEDRRHVREGDVSRGGCPSTSALPARGWRSGCRGS
ncbi:MAG: hypothetical protein RML12_00565 [Xanthomonadales bacterium]|nr:hypothetical protein [Xanthomonadales bacterium]